MSISALLLLLLCVLRLPRVDGASTGGSSNLSATQLWAAANRDWERERVDETLRWLLQLEHASPDDPTLHMALGAVYQRKVCM